MTTFKKIAIWTFGIAFFISLCGFSFYAFYLKPKINISAAVSELKSNTIFTENILDSMYKHTKDKIRNSACLSFAMIENGKVHYYGFQRANDKLRTIENSDSLYQIGSISKVFTSTILANLIVNKEINPEETIDTHLGFPLKDNLKIKLKDLSNHTSGLDRMPKGVYLESAKDFYQPYKNYTAEWMDNYLKNKIEVNKADIGISNYSNLGASILGHVLSITMKKSYSELLQARILDKYKMKSTFLYSDVHKDKVVHSRDMNDSLTKNWVLHSFNPAGGIVSNSKDMALFALAQMDSHNKELLLTQIPTVSLDSTMAVGMGWHIIKSKLNHKVLWHNGATANFNSSFAIDLDTKKAIVILSNANYLDTKGCLDNLSFSILNYLNTK